VDLRAFARDWTKSEEKLSHLSGRAFATLQLSTASDHGGKSAIDLLSGEGTFEVIEGEFYDLPVLSEIASAITLNKNAAEVGQAAGRFHVANRRLQVDPVAVAAPVMGICGEGKAIFVGYHDFMVVF